MPALAGRAAAGPRPLFPQKARPIYPPARRPSAAWRAARRGNPTSTPGPSLRADRRPTSSRRRRGQTRRATGRNRAAPGPVRRSADRQPSSGARLARPALAMTSAPRRPGGVYGSSARARQSKRCPRPRRHRPKVAWPSTGRWSSRTGRPCMRERRVGLARPGQASLIRRRRRRQGRRRLAREASFEATVPLVAWASKALTRL